MQKRLGADFSLQKEKQSLRKGQVCILKREGIRFHSLSLQGYFRIKSESHEGFKVNSY